MRPGQRIAVSLLVTILIFTVFTFLAYSGLFNYIEQTIYNSRVSANIQNDLEAKKRVIAEFHEDMQARFGEIFSDPIFWQVYRNTESRELIERLSEADALLARDISGYLGFRFLDEDGKIWNSSFPADLRESSDTRKVFNLFEDVEPDRQIENYTVREQAEFRIESDGQRFAYLIPIRNTIEEYQGTLVIYVGYSSLLNTLASRNVLEVGQSSLLAGEKAYIFNSRILVSSERISEIGAMVSASVREPQQRVLGEEEGEIFNLYSRPAAEYGGSGIHSRIGRAPAYRSPEDPASYTRLFDTVSPVVPRAQFPAGRYGCHQRTDETLSVWFSQRVHQ